MPITQEADQWPAKDASAAASGSPSGPASPVSELPLGSLAGLLVVLSEQAQAINHLASEVSELAQSNQELIALNQEMLASLIDDAGDEEGDDAPPTYLNGAPR